MARLAHLLHLAHLAPRASLAQLAGGPGKTGWHRRQVSMHRCGFSTFDGAPQEPIPMRHARGIELLARPPQGAGGAASVFLCNAARRYAVPEAEAAQQQSRRR